MTDTENSGRLEEVAGARRPVIRRHLFILVFAVVAFVLGVVLVVTGRPSPESAQQQPSSTLARGPLLVDLGVVDDEDAARDLIADLDPSSLEPGDGAQPPTATAPPSDVDGVDLTEAGVQRCQQPIAQQTTDRSLGARQAAARLTVGKKPSFVVSYELPASGADPAGVRVVVIDARTCRVLTAVEL